MDGQTDGQMDGQTDGHTDGQTDGQTGRIYNIKHVALYFKEDFDAFMGSFKIRAKQIQL